LAQATLTHTVACSSHSPSEPLFSMSSVWARRFLALSAIHTIAGLRQDGVQDGSINVAQKGVQCSTVDEVLNMKVPVSAEEKSDLFEPLAQALRKCKTGRMGAWKGSHLQKVIYQEGHVKRFRSKGMDLILTKNTGVLGSTFKLCFWSNGDDAQDVWQSEYKPTAESAGKSVPAYCFNGYEPKYKNMPHGVAGQAASELDEPSISIPFKISYEAGDTPMAVWELLDSKGAIPLHEQFAQNFNGEKNNDDASDVVESYKARFRDLGIGLYFIAHRTECMMMMPSGQFEETTEVHRWVEYADLKVVGDDYNPSWKGLVRQKH